MVLGRGWSAGVLPAGLFWAFASFGAVLALLSSRAFFLLLLFVLILVFLFAFFRHTLI